MMNPNLKNIVWVAVAAVAMTGLARQKKLVSCAWEWGGTGPGELRELQPQIAAAGYDGVQVRLRFKTANGWRGGRSTTVQSDWEWEDLAAEIPKYRDLMKKEGLRESFLSVSTIPAKRFRWTDDAAWSVLAKNMRLLARFAREAGFRGIMIDHEDYPKQRQYERLADDPPFEELSRIARRRGREIAGGMFEEYPDIRLFFFWFFSDYIANVVPGGDTEQALRDSNHLLAFYYNGFLDVLPPDAKIIDGNEATYRNLASRSDYYRTIAQQRDVYLHVALPENRAKYMKQVSHASAMYLDMYVNPPTDKPGGWYKAPSSGSRLRTYCRDLRQALDSSDEYVWTWSERNPVVKRQRKKKYEWYEDVIWWSPTYDEKMPGFSDAVLAVAKPKAFLDGRFKTLLKEGLVDDMSPGPFTKSMTWQSDYKGRRKAGEFRISEDGKELSFIGVPGAVAQSSGCWNVSVKNVAPGEIFVCRVEACPESGGFSSSVTWKNKGAWETMVPRTALSFGSPHDGGWRQGEAVVVVPEGVDEMAFFFAVYQLPGEKCRIRRPEIYRLRQ